jgi:hypothetical protein
LDAGPILSKGGKSDKEKRGKKKSKCRYNST